MIQASSLSTPADTHPAVVLDHALRVSYVGQHATPELGRTLDGRRTMIEAVVGDTLQFIVSLAFVNATVALVRKPASNDTPAPDDDGPVAQAKRAIAAKAGKLDGGRLQIGSPGLYVIRVTLTGDWSREIAIAAFSPKALDRLEYPPDFRQQRRRRLRAIVGDPRVTRDTVIDSIELGDCEGLGPRLLGGEAFSLRNYGGDS